MPEICSFFHNQDYFMGYRDVGCDNKNQFKLKRESEVKRSENKFFIMSHKKREKLDSTERQKISDLIESGAKNQ